MLNQNEELRIQKKRRNFTMVDNDIINNPNLSFKAKGIMTYLLSKPDGWKVIVKNLMNYSTDGKDAIYSGLKELKRYGYYSKVPIRNEKGIITHWESTIYEDPSENPSMTESYPLMDNPQLDMEALENIINDPLTGFPEVDNPDMDNPLLGNPHRNNTNINNIEKNNISSHLSTSDEEKINENDVDEDIDNDNFVSVKNNFMITPKENYDLYKQIIHENIEYEHFKMTLPYDINEIDELVDCMLDVICSQGNTVKINSENKSREMVKSVYLKLNSGDIEHILERFKEQRHKITYIHEYLKTMLYNARLENSHYYTNAVRADGVVR